MTAMIKKAEKDSDWRLRPLDDELGEALRAELLGWPGVIPRPMMGTLAFFRRKRMIGCYVNRALAKKKTEWMNRPAEPTLVWVRLRPEDAERALERPSVGACRLKMRGWIEIALESRAALEEAVRWLGHAYEHPPQERAARRSKAKRKKPR
jgi:hypothetical protein